MWKNTNSFRDEAKCRPDVYFGTIHTPVLSIRD